MEEKVKQLQKAKDNVIWLINNPTGSVDCHGLIYWAEVVERLREEIRKNL